MSNRPGFKDYVKSLPNDFMSSIVVFLVALPLCLGIALASNAPLFSGLIAGVVGGIVVGFVSKSHLSVSGPAAGLTAIVSAAVISLQSWDIFIAAVVICGVIQLILGFLKAGIIGDYVPNSVIKGMLAAIGLILILKQFPHLIGYDSDFEGDETFLQANSENTFSGLFRAFGHITPVAALIGISCLVFHFIWEKLVAGRKGFIKLLPAPLLIVVIGVGINYYFAQSNSGYALEKDHLVSIPAANSAAEFFSFFTTPDWSKILNPEVLKVGVTLALVASLESLLSIEAVDDLDPYQRVTPTSRELKAQGLGNLVSGLIGGLPVTSVIVRSSANVNAGAKTKMSTIYHGILLLLCVSFIPVILNKIPNAALAAILIYTGYKLAKPSLFKAFYKKGWDQFIPFIVTISAILFTDLLKGVMIGIGVGLFFVLRSNFKTSVFVVHDKMNYLFRLRKDVSFLNKAIIKNKLEKVPAEAFVIIDTTRADFIDKDVVETIEDFMLHAPLKNIRVELKRSSYKEQGFSKRITTRDKNPVTTSLVRTHEKEIVPVAIQA
ncbi:MAG: SulP family inorganic anion transporter [Bacteroidetes bacterium]|nr:SulP family inorganic anion transporter [Bacteroidota bacterium]